MAVYQFSALSDGQSISFNPNSDVLNFDQSAIAAADIRISVAGSNVVVTYPASGKDVTLLNVSPLQLATSNVTFAGGSSLLFGDNSPGTSADNAANTLGGTAGRDHLRGFGGNDTLGGGSGGDDWLEGGAGNDRLAGGSGKDSFAFREAGAGNGDLVTDFSTGWDNIQVDANSLTGLGATGQFASGDARFAANAIGTAQDASDRIIFNTSTLQVFYDADGAGGAAGQLLFTITSGRTVTATDFWVIGTPSAAVINGTEGHDELFGTPGHESINGFGGNDTIEGNGGNDTVDGGTGFDVVSFRNATGSVTVNFATGTGSGGGGNVAFTNIEMAQGGDFADVLIAGGSGAWLSAGAGNDSLTGGAGSDYLHGDGVLDFGSGGPNFATGDDSIAGGGGEDTIIGWRGNDTLQGGAGNDLFQLEGGFEGNYGTDTIDGGAGVDTVELDASAAVIVEFFSARLIGGVEGANASATLIGIENFVVFATAGAGFDDRITGNNDANRLEAGDGDDTLNGSGNNDTLVGGGGADHLVFDQPSGIFDADQVIGFESGVDKVVFDDATFTALGSRGNFIAGDPRFAANASGTAQDASDRVVYNTSTGELWYDADGSGSAAAQLIATLVGAPSLAATDIIAEDDGNSNAIVGTEGDDTLIGTEHAEVIEGRGGNDSIDGRGGNDTIDGGTGNDSVTGSGRILGGDGDDVLETDQFYPGGSIMFGGAGNDTLFGFQELYGEDGDDLLHAHHEASVLMNGGAGNDTVWNFDLNDTVDGGEGSDTVLVFEQGPLLVNLAAGIITDKSGTMSASVLNVENIDRREQHVNGQDDHDYYFDDYLVGSDAANLLRPGSGNDTLDGGLGNDTLSAGELSDDVLTFSSAPSGANADVVLGFASGRTHLQLEAAAYSGVGPRGNFVSGDARFFAGAGASSGQDASDRVVYNTTTGQLWYDADGSGAGAAQLIAILQGAATLAATDIAVVDSRSAPAGTAGDDWMAGRDGYVDDNFSGGGGNDRFDGREGHDTLDGGEGNDTLDGGDGADLLVGGAGNDTLRKASEFADSAVGPDTLNGGLGDDTYELDFRYQQGAGQAITFDFVFQDAGGVDTIVINDSWTLGAGFENLTLRGNFFSGGSVGLGNELDNVIRSEGTLSSTFTLDGGDGNDTLLGGEGQDEFVFFEGSGNYGNDSVDGGTGDSDRIDFDSARSAITVDMRGGTLTGGGVSGSGSVAFANIDSVWGGAFADRMTANDDGVNLVGGGGNDTLIGGAGVDFLDGGTGNDSIAGGAGNDWMWGDEDADSFLFTVAPSSANADRLFTFSSGEDKIQLDGAVHANIGATGNFAAGDARFAANATGSAQDASDRVIYNTANGQLWYDADGNGAGAAQLIATVENAPTLVATDIAVINGGSSGVITGTSGNDSLTGTSGNDTLDGLGGTDTMNGMGGDDTYFVTAGDVIQDSGGIDHVFAAASYALAGGIENITYTGTANTSSEGNSLANAMTGNGGGNAMNAKTGNDTLNGAGGNDTLTGGAGNDWMTGGAGADAFIFNVAPGAANADVITDFASGSDKLRLDDAFHAGIGATGNFAAGDGRFWAAAGATAGHDANDRVVYDTSTGSLYYDADGSGAGAAQLIATFTGNPTMAAADITVV